MFSSKPTVMPGNVLRILRIIVLVLVWWLVVGFTSNPTDHELITFCAILLIDLYIDFPTSAS